MPSNWGSPPSDLSEVRVGTSKEGKVKNFQYRIFPHTLDQGDIQRLKNRRTREWNKKNLISMAWGPERGRSLGIEPLLSTSIETDPAASFHTENDYNLDVGQLYICDGSTCNQIQYPGSQLQPTWTAKELYVSPTQFKILQFISLSRDAPHFLPNNIDLPGCLQPEVSALVKTGSSCLVEALEVGKNQDCGNTGTDKASKVVEGNSVLEDGDSVFSCEDDEEPDDGSIHQSDSSSDWEDDAISILSVQDSDFQRIEVKHNPSRKSLLAKKLQTYTSSCVSKKTARIPCGPSPPPAMNSDSDDEDQSPINSEDDEEQIVPGDLPGSQTKPPFLTKASSPRTTRQHIITHELPMSVNEHILNERTHGPIGRVKEIDYRMKKRLERCKEEPLKRLREELLRHRTIGDNEYDFLLNTKAIWSRHTRSQHIHSQDSRSQDIWSQNLHDYNAW